MKNRDYELLFIETDGACAYCGHKDNRVLTIHHLEQTVPKNEDYDNKLVLCHNCHQSYHQKKGASAEELNEIKRRLIIKTLTRPGLSALREAYRYSLVAAMPFLVNHLVDFGYLVQGNMIRGEWTDNGVPKYIIDAEYTITPQGKNLLEKWGIK